MYRTRDLSQLQDIFARQTNDIAILCGASDSGIYGIVRDFAKDKQCLYYRASSVTDPVQRMLFAGEVFDQTKTPIFPSDDYGKLITSVINDGTSKKKLMIIDNFRYILKEDSTLINFLTKLLSEESAPGSAMILLVTDDVTWANTDMVKMLGRKSSEITGVIKIDDFSPTEFRELFPQMPLSEMIGIYSFVGGRSGRYNGITNESTLKDVIISYLGMWDIHRDPDHFLPRGIREPSLYNTILVHLSSGAGKLSRLHELTGVDRAKLAVYLKTLCEHGIVEKIDSEPVGDDTVKGSYRIREGIVRFYYRFVFRRASSLFMNGPDRFYKKYIEHEIYTFIDEFYPFFCMEHINWLKNESRLNFKVASVGEYHDKDGAIDFVIVAAGGSVIACACQYSTGLMSFKRYEEVKASVRKNHMNCDNIWLFSAGGFDQKLTMTESVSIGLKLIEGHDQRLR